MLGREAFEINGKLDLDSGFTQSPLNNAFSSNSFDSNPAFNGLSRQLRASAASDTFADQLDRFAPDSRADIRANSSSAVNNDFDSEFLFDESRFLAGVPSQLVRNTKLDSKTDFDILTGKYKDAPLVDITSYDSLTNIQGAKTRASSFPSAPTTTLMAEATSQTAAPTFAVRSEGTMSINGGGDFDGNPVDPTDDAFIYGAKGFTINGNPVLPVQRDASGNPILDRSGKPILVNNALTVAQGYTVSNAPGNRYANLLPPQVVQKQTVNVPAYSDIKQQELASTIPSGTQTVTFNAQANPINNASQWASKFPGNGYSGHPTVVRVTNGGLNIPSNVDLSHIVITVENGDINFNGSGHDLDEVVLVTNNGNINLASVRANDLSVFSSRSINTNGGARFAGETMLANGSSGGNIAFNGATATTNATDNLTVISQGDITYNGASSTRGTFSSVKNFTFNGNSTLLGEIGAKGNIIFNGKATVTAAFTDPIPPAITAALANDTAPGGTTNTDRITSDPTIAGTIADASAVTAFRAGFDNTPTSSFVNVLNHLGADGSFTFTGPQLEQINGSVVLDGNRTLHFVAQDQYGNVSNLDFTFTLDTQAPVAPSGLKLTQATDTGASNSDNITNNTTPTIQGNADAGSLVWLFKSGQLVGQTTTTANGTWQLAVAPLSDGLYTFTATAEDFAGNVSQLSDELVVTIDTTAPIAPSGLNLLANSDSGYSIALHRSVRTLF